MANDSPRKMTTADLRKRLTVAPSTAAPLVFPDDNPRATPSGGRLETVAEMEHEISEGHGVNFTLPAVEPTQATPIPRRLTTHDFVRPVVSASSSRMGKSSDPGTGRQSSAGLPRLGRNSQVGFVADTNAEADPNCALFGSSAPSSTDHLDAQELRQENESLQQLLDEMRQLLQEASENEQKMQTQLEEALGELDKANERAATLEAEIANKPKSSQELEEMADELEREGVNLAQQKRRIDEDRKQLREDEMALEKQMREMEVSMARERAVLARQETELKRLSAEISHEIESLQRGDASLRDRLSVFQRRQADVMSGSAQPSGGSYAGFAPVSGPSHFGAAPVPPEVLQANPTPPPQKKNDTTGLLRKIFRSGPTGQEG